MSPACQLRVNVQKAIEDRHPKESVMRILRETLGELTLAEIAALLAPAPGGSPPR